MYIHFFHLTACEQLYPELIVINWVFYPLLLLHFRRVMLQLCYMTYILNTFLLLYML